MSGEQKQNNKSQSKISSPLRTANGGDSNSTAGTVDSPSGPSSQSNKELLSSLQNRAQVFNQLWQAVEKVQGESISIATWKAKLKELEDAKSATKKLANELKNATGRNAELITHNAALMASREELNRALGLRDGRIEGLGAQLSQARDEIQSNILKHEDALGKEQRAKALTAAELRDKIAENLSARGQITELVSETQALKTELLRSKEMNRINNEGLHADLKAAKDHVVALEKDKASISQHLWNVTDEIKKMAHRLETAESLSEERLQHLEETRTTLTKLQESSAQTEAEMKRDLHRLRDRNSELSDELSMLRRLKDKWEQDADASTNALRSELESLHAKLREQEKERNGFIKRTEKAEKQVIDIKNNLENQVEEFKLKLSDERTAHRELRNKMEENLKETKDQVIDLQNQIKDLEAARGGQAVTLDELRSALIKAKERVRELENSAQESDLAMGSVRKKLEQHLHRARSEVKRLQQGADSMNVKYAEDMEQLQTKLRVAEEALLEKTNELNQSGSKAKEREDTLTKENYQLREITGKQNVAIVEERKKSEQLQSMLALARTDAEREVAGVQSELSKALEQAVKDSDKARQKNDESRMSISKLETEKREILQEASKLNVELGIQLNEVKSLRGEINRYKETESKLKNDLESMQSSVGDGNTMIKTLETQLSKERQDRDKKDREHANALEISRKELKLAQKEAAERVAKFSEHGRAMATDIERLTTKQAELISNLEQRESELKDSTKKVNELKIRVNDVKKLRSEVATDLEKATQSLKEERANNMQLKEEKETLMKNLDMEKQLRTGGEQSLKIAMRKEKKAMRDMDKVEKEKLKLQTELEREKLVVPPLQAQIRGQTAVIAGLEQKIKESVIKHDVAESRAKKQAQELARDIENLKLQVQNARDSTDVELKKRLKVEKEAKDFEGEAQKTVNELIRQLKEAKKLKEKDEAQLQQQLDIQLEYASTMKRERDRQIQNSKSAATALREDAETQRRLAGLLEKEKTELKSMLQDKWKEARHLKDRLEEAEAKLYEASNSVENWQQTKRDLEATVEKQKRRIHEIKTKASASEDRLGAELKDATSRASQMAAELTTLKHSSLWNDRELGNKVSLLTKEVEVLNGQLHAKDAALERSQQQEMHLKQVAEQLRGAAEAMGADMRSQMKLLDEQHQEHIAKLKDEMKNLRDRSQTATEAMQRMQLEVRARRLESESLSREVNSVSETSDEFAKNLEKAEESRSALLQELDRARQDKTNLVKAMVEERNAAADEAGALQRNISGLNARIRQLSDDLEQSNRSRKSLRSNLRRQVINELRSSGWTAPTGFNGFDWEDDGDNSYDSSHKRGGSNKKEIKKTENPIAKMRRLREALTQSGSESSSGNASSSTSKNSSISSVAKDKNKEKNNRKAHMHSDDVPPNAANSVSTTPVKMTPPPPMTPETNNTLQFSQQQNDLIAADLGTAINIVDRNPMEIGFEPPKESQRNVDIIGSENEGISGMNPVSDSLNRTERFLEKRRNRDKKLQQQVDKDRIKRESRESIHAATVDSKARRISSREGNVRLPGL